MRPSRWSRANPGYKIEVVTARVGDAWICQQIRISLHPKTMPPTLLTLDGSFPSISQALDAGEAHARRWIDQAAQQ